MTTSSQRRLVQDLQRLRKNESDGILAAPHSDNIFIWQAYIQGPTDTIWQAGTFRLLITATEQYPHTAPKVVFISKMFHPNVFNDGSTNLDILHKDWNVMYDITAILTSIRSLLAEPNLQSPANHEASSMLKNHPKQYEMRVKEIVELSWVSKLSLDCQTVRE